MKKIWKDVIGYKGLYQVSNYGEIKSLNYISKYSKKNYIRSPKTSFLSKNGVKKSANIAKIVAEHFIPNPYKKPVVLHKDFNRLNNKISNLIWMTHKEVRDYLISRKRLVYKTGEEHPLYGVVNISICGENNHLCKLTDKQVATIRERFAKGETQTKLAKEYKVSQFNISRIVNNKNRIYLTTK